MSSIRDIQRELRQSEVTKGNFVKGAVSSRTALAERPKGIAGTAGHIVGKYPKTVATGGVLTLVALGAGGVKAAEKGQRKADQKITKRDKYLSNEDKASLAIGGGAGAALMPMRAPKARDGRRDQIAQLKSDVEAAGGKAGEAVDIDLNPNVATRISEKSGIRAQNRSYTHNKAANQQFAPDKRYHLAMYQDDGGIRQLGGKHYLAAQAIKGEDVKARVHLMEGSRPAEPTAVQALLRPVKGHLERKALAAEVASPQAAINRRAARYRSSGINAQIARVADKEGELRLKPGLTREGVKALHQKQAMFIAGGAGAMYAGNKLLRGEKNGPTKAITGTSTKVSDLTRNKVADVISPNEKKEIGKALVVGSLTPQQQADLDQAAHRYVKASGKVRRKNKIRGVAGLRPLPPPPTDYVRKRDNRDRYGAAAGGAAVGAAAMPVRDAGGRADKAFAEKYGHLPSGQHDIASRDLQTIAAPGRRPNNRGYTLKGAQSIVEGKWNPEPITVRVYRDAAKTAGGAHRTQARAFAQQPTQKVNIERHEGYYPRTRPGIESAVYRARRVIQPHRFMSWTPKSHEELKTEAGKIDQSVVDRALKHATDSPHADLGPGLTEEGLKALKGKQKAFIAGGAAGGLALNELRRRHNANIGKGMPSALKNYKVWRAGGVNEPVKNPKDLVQFKNSLRLRRNQGGKKTAIGNFPVQQSMSRAYTQQRKQAHDVGRDLARRMATGDVSIQVRNNRVVAGQSARKASRLALDETRRGGSPSFGYRDVQKGYQGPYEISKKRPPGAPNAFLHPIKRTKWGVNQGIANASRTAGENAVAGAAQQVKQAMGGVNLPNLGPAAEHIGAGIGSGGKAVGAGVLGAGLLAGGTKLVGDAIGASASKKTAQEATKRAAMYTAGGVGGAGLIGGGIALSGRKRNGS